MGPCRFWAVDGSAVGVVTDGVHAAGLEKLWLFLWFPPLECTHAGIKSSISAILTTQPTALCTHRHARRKCSRWFYSCWVRHSRGHQNEGSGGRLDACTIRSRWPVHNLRLRLHHCAVRENLLLLWGSGWKNKGIVSADKHMPCLCVSTFPTSLPRSHSRSE